MTHYAVIPLAEPLYVRVPGRRAQELSWAVLENGALKVRAVFASERQADSYARRLNQWQRENA